MEYTVIKKRTNKQQHIKNVVKVTETARTFKFILEHGEVWEFHKSKYEFYSLEVEELTEEKKKIAEMVANNALKFREDMRRKILPPKEKLVEILNQFFSMEDTDAYWLTRAKSAFAVGTVTIDDFKEFTDETINELADFIINEIIK